MESNQAYPEGSCTARVLNALYELTPPGKKVSVIKKETLLREVERMSGKNYRASAGSSIKFDNTLASSVTNGLVLQSKEIIKKKKVVSFTLTSDGLAKLEEIKSLKPQLLQSSTQLHAQQKVA